MKRAISCLAVLVCLLAPLQRATAAALPSGGLTPTEVAAWLQSHGVTASVAPDPVTPDSEKIVKATSDGLNWSVYFLNCADHRCASIQYAVGLSKTADATTIADWNSHWRFIRAYLSTSGYPWGEMDVDVSPGGSYALLDQSLARWRSMMTKFKDTVEPS
jgi:hypothetical protein